MSNVNKPVSGGGGSSSSSNRNSNPAPAVGQGGYNNTQDYRLSVSSDHLKTAQKDWQIAAKSVGTFFDPTSVLAVDPNHLEQGFRIDLEISPPKDGPVHKDAGTLRRFVSVMGGSNAVLDNYRCWDERVVGDGSLYHVGDGRVVTAGHVLSKGLGKREDECMVVFGVTAEQCTKGSQTIVPAANVFVLDKVLFWQNQLGDNKDRCDWALLQIRPRVRNIDPPFPPALQVLPPQASYGSFEGLQDIFGLGYPWGLSMRLTDPKEANLVPFRKLLASYQPGKEPLRKPLQYCFRHNILNHPGNSGGPLFLRNKDKPMVVIGSTVANGRANPGVLGTWGFNKDQATNEIHIDVPPTNEQSDDEFNIATRTDVWYNLTVPDVTLNVIFQLAPKTPGSLELLVRIRLPSLDNLTERFVLYATDIDAAAVAAPARKIKIPRRFSDLLATGRISATTAARVRPCDIVGVEARYHVPGEFTSSMTMIPGEAKVALFAVTVVGANAPSANSDVTILRATDAEINTPINCLDALTFQTKAAAREDENGAVVVA